MQVIDRIKDEGHKLTSFISWCGGLVAPENSNNPLGYKFSWFPRGVLTAGLNSAQFKLHSQNKAIPDNQLLNRHFSNVPLFKGFAFEGLANRDSLSYANIYGLELAHLNTMLRGTLRYKGYSDLMEAFRRLGLLDADPEKPVNSASFTHFINIKLGTAETRNGVAHHLRLKPSHPIVNRVVAAFHDFGMIGPSAIQEPIYAPTSLDAFCAILQRALTLNPSDRDMVCMVHEFEALTSKGTTEIYKTSLVSYGEPGGTTAMAKTVGIPTAIATHLLLQGKIKTKGVIRPTLKEIYDPMLAQLESKGIKFTEQKLTSSLASMKSHLSATGSGSWSN